jgi:hypothetical protein
MDRCTFSKKNQVWLIISTIVLWLNVLFAASALAEEQLDFFDQKVLDWAQNCAADVTKQIELSLVSGTLNVGQIFDTFYIPIPETNPQKYHTQYDKYFDEAMRPVIDGYQKKNKRILFAIAVDRNGYLPTHNTKYAQPITGDADHDAKWNRTKRIFNDTTGLAAASNTKPYLLQKYSRDTGEVMSDLSVPIYINGQHWGAVRFGYK